MKNLIGNLKWLLLSSFLICGTAWAESQYVESGFLQDYTKLVADPERPNVRIYIAPGAKSEDYEKFLLADIEIFLHPESEYTGISARRLGAISQEFAGYVRDNLSTRLEQVDEVIPGDKTLVFRLAISNVYAKRPDRTLLHYTPVGVIGTGAKKAAGRDYALATAAFEGELIEGETGQTVAALVATNLGESLAKDGSGDRKWSDIQEYLRDYANTLRDRFAEMQE